MPPSGSASASMAGAATATRRGRRGRHRRHPRPAVGGVVARCRLGEGMEGAGAGLLRSRDVRSLRRRVVGRRVCPGPAAPELLLQPATRIKVLIDNRVFHGLLQEGQARCPPAWPGIRSTTSQCVAGEWPRSFSNRLHPRAKARGHSGVVNGREPRAAGGRPRCPAAREGHRQRMPQEDVAQIADRAPESTTAAAYIPAATPRAAPRLTGCVGSLSRRAAATKTSGPRANARVSAKQRSPIGRLAQGSESCPRTARSRATSRRTRAGVTTSAVPTNQNARAVQHLERSVRPQSRNRHAGQRDASAARREKERPLVVAPYSGPPARDETDERRGRAPRPPG